MTSATWESAPLRTTRPIVSEWPFTCCIIWRKELVHRSKAYQSFILSGLFPYLNIDDSMHQLWLRKFEDETLIEDWILSRSLHMSSLLCQSLSICITKRQFSVRVGSSDETTSLQLGNLLLHSPDFFEGCTHFELEETGESKSNCSPWR